MLRYVHICLTDLQSRALLWQSGCKLQTRSCSVSRPKVVQRRLYMALGILQRGTPATTTPSMLQRSNRSAHHRPDLTIETTVAATSVPHRLLATGSMRRRELQHWSSSLRLCDRSCSLPCGGCSRCGKRLLGSCTGGRQRSYITSSISPSLRQRSRGCGSTHYFGVRRCSETAQKLLLPMQIDSGSSRLQCGRMVSGTKLMLPRRDGAGNSTA